MKYSKEISKIIEEENENWSNIFLKELQKGSHEFKKYSSYWWELYYMDIVLYFKTLISKFEDPKILEAGSGSGKASILLGADYDRTFLDISIEALNYAQFLAEKFHAQNIKYVEGNIFNMPFKDKSFNLVWNIGVVEHYDSESVKKMLTEMVRVVATKGCLAIAVPNFRSPAIIKAKILSKLPFLKFIPGYRLGSEKRYSAKKLIPIIENAVRVTNRTIEHIDVKYFGNPLITETPKWIIKSLGKVTEQLFPKRKFLIFIICQIK